jgi:hypothetical protein
LAGRVDFHHGSAVALPFEAASFDVAALLHGTSTISVLFARVCIACCAREACSPSTM